MDIIFFDCPKCGQELAVTVLVRHGKSSAVVQ